ncbi:hypothetical protein OAA06_00050 [bacterium]|nr:hypothetical protein [bacterium]
MLPQKTIDNWQTLLNLFIQTNEIALWHIDRINGGDFEVIVSNFNNNQEFPVGHSFPIEKSTSESLIYSVETKSIYGTRHVISDELEDIPYTYMGIPITWPNGTAFGVLNLYSEKDNLKDAELSLSEIVNIIHDQLALTYYRSTDIEFDALLRTKNIEESKLSDNPSAFWLFVNDALEIVKTNLEPHGVNHLVYLGGFLNCGVCKINKSCTKKTY